MSMQSEHKPHPWGKVAAENTKAARLTPSPRLTGIDPAIDADVLRVSVDFEPEEIAQAMIPNKPSEVISLLTQRIELGGAGGPGQVGWSAG